MNRDCFGCDAKEEVKKIDIEQLIEEQLSLEIDLVSEEEWVKRQGVCLKCPFRIEETCQKCGCFYRFRTALSMKNCPEDKW